MDFFAGVKQANGLLPASMSQLFLRVHCCDGRHVQDPIRKKHWRFASSTSVKLCALGWDFRRLRCPVQAILQKQQKRN